MKQNQKLIPFNELHQLHGQEVVLCHGVFDILHAGHLAYFESAKRHGRKLIVSVTTDRHVNKGPNRPYFTDKIRAKVLSSLDIVDGVVISDHPTATPIINALKPKAYAKGPDYRDFSRDVTGEIRNEVEAVRAHGGDVVFTDDDTYSSSAILNRFFMPWSDEQVIALETIKKLGGMDLIESELEKVSRLDVSVVGEPIEDVYRFCTPENISSKSPSISARFSHEESYDGGAWAIRAHLSDFVHSASLHLPMNFPRVRKIRYIAMDRSQRIFEITELPADNYTLKNHQKFTEELKTLRPDLFVLADFGHRLFEHQVINHFCDVVTQPIALNVQTNSSNFGFNLFHKHKRFDYLSLDTREIRLAYHDRSSDLSALTAQVIRDLKSRPWSLTLGTNGSLFYDGRAEYKSPAFADQVIDATGAGDAYFALTSCLVRVKSPAPLIPFLGNVFAGLKTKIIGNKSAVSKASLLKACTSLLK